MDIIGAIGSINALILAILLGNKKNKSISDKILIAWVINFSFYFANYFIFERQLMTLAILWSYVWGISMAIHPIFLYLYTISLTRKNFVLNFRVLSNFFFIIPWIISMIPYQLLTIEEQEALVYSKQSIAFELFLPMMVMLCIDLFYFIRSLIVIIQHQSSIENEFSYHSKINLSWIKLLIYVYIIIIISDITGYSLASSKLINIKVMDDIMMIVRMILFFYIVYSGYKQNTIYKIKAISDSNLKTGESHVKAETSKTKTEKHKKEEQNEMVLKLRDLMETEQLFLEPELSLGDTANKLGMHVHQLSKLINEEMNKNFFEFVNEYRVDEFKKLATKSENKHISILGLAYDAGFNSKATFNRFFKNSTGLTPSQFRENFKF